MSDQPFSSDLACYHATQVRDTFLSFSSAPTPADFGSFAPWTTQHFSSIRARERCKENLRRCWEAVETQWAQHKAWKMRREEHFRNALQQSELQDAKCGIEGFAWYCEFLQIDPNEVPVPVSGWVPWDLLSVQEPIVNGPLPLSSVNRLTLPGCYAIFALIHDEYNKAGDPLCPWTQVTHPQAFHWFRAQTLCLADLTAEHMLTLDAAKANVQQDLQTSAMPIIWSHGGSAYSRDGADSYAVNTEEDNILQSFLESGKAMDSSTLTDKSGVTNIARVMKRLQGGYGGIFSDAIRLPGKKGTGGYFACVRTLRAK